MVESWLFSYDKIYITNTADDYKNEFLWVHIHVNVSKSNLKSHVLDRATEGVWPLTQFLIWRTRYESKMLVYALRY